MSNYEEFYAALLPLEKALKDSAGAIAKAQKNIAKNTATGNLTEAKKLAAGLSEGIRKRADGPAGQPGHPGLRYRRRLCPPAVGRLRPAQHRRARGKGRV